MEQRVSDNEIAYGIVSMEEQCSRGHSELLTGVSWETLLDLFLDLRDERARNVEVNNQGSEVN